MFVFFIRLDDFRRLELIKTCLLIGIGSEWGDIYSEKNIFKVGRVNNIL